MEPQVTHEVISTPFQVAMDCQHVHIDADHICWNCTVKIIDMAEAAEARAASLEGALETIRAETFMPDGTRLYDAVKQIMQERDDLRRKLSEVKTILAVGRNVGEDKEQAYQDAEEIIDFALNGNQVEP